MKRKQTRVIVGAAIGVAAVAVAIDHTRHRLPEPEEQAALQQAVIIIDEGEEIPQDNEGDCGKPLHTGTRTSPCSL